MRYDTIKRLLLFFLPSNLFAYDFRGTMEERVRELFKDGLKCNEEVEQIKNIYKYVIVNISS